MGLGISTSFARIGGALAPSLCALFSDDIIGVLWTCTVIAFIASMTVMCLPHDSAHEDADSVADTPTRSVHDPSA